MIIVEIIQLPRHFIDLAFFQPKGYVDFSILKPNKSCTNSFLNEEKLFFHDYEYFCLLLLQTANFLINIIYFDIFFASSNPDVLKMCSKIYYSDSRKQFKINQCVNPVSLRANKNRICSKKVKIRDVARENQEEKRASKEIDSTIVPHFISTNPLL